MYFTKRSICRSFFACFLLLIIFNCSSKNGYIIKGTSNNIPDKTSIYIKTVDNDGKLKTIDSTIVTNNTFKFSGKVNHPSLHYVTIDQTKNSFVLPIFLENSNSKLNIDARNPKGYNFEGSKSHKEFKKFNDDYKSLTDDLLNKKTEFQNNISKLDSIRKEEKSNEIKALQNAIKNYSLNFIEKNPKSYVSLHLIKSMSKNRLAKYKDSQNAFNALDENLKNSPASDVVMKRLEELKQIDQKNQTLQIGAKPQNFKATTFDGKTISLDEVTSNHKVTILEFWAAWCLPCRQENANLVKLYEQYKDKGLEILSVSVDGDPRRKQENPKQEWVRAIKEDGITWYQVSYLKGFDGPIAELYNLKLSGIPVNFIIGDDGKIIAKDLRGTALQTKINELLNN